MGQRIGKLGMALAGLLLSLVLLTGAAYAWFSISTAPEIQGIRMQVTRTGKEYPFELSLDYGEMGDQASWTTQLHLDALLGKMNTLRPVSTCDGQNWYLPIYGANGNVTGFTRIDNIGEYSNLADANTNYFTYADIWIRTRDKDTDYQVKLSNPLDLAGVKAEGKETDFGTYVLSRPRWKEGRPVTGDDAMACLRIGFQFLTGGGESEEQREEKFYIYEPNAEMRSAAIKAFVEANAEQQKGNDSIGYLFTQGEGGADSITAKTYIDQYADRKQVFDTMVPRLKPGGQGQEEGYTLVSPDSQDDIVLIRQMTSSWKNGLTQGSKISSKDIGAIGAFIDGNMQETDTPPMTTLTEGTVKRLRLYIWLEGQDIDCWNQIAGGSIYANLELTGKAVPKESAAVN